MPGLLARGIPVQGDAHRLPARRGRPELPVRVHGRGCSRAASAHVSDGERSGHAVGAEGEAVVSRSCCAHAGGPRRLQDARSGERTPPLMVCRRTGSATSSWLRTTGELPTRPAEEYQDHRQDFDVDALPPVTLDEAIFDLPRRAAGEGHAVESFNREVRGTDPRYRRYLAKFGLSRRARGFFTTTPCATTTSATSSSTPCCGPARTAFMCSSDTAART